MNNIDRKEKFDEFISWMDKQHKSLPKLDSKFIGISLPFPEDIGKQNKIIEGIRKLKNEDSDVCISVKYKQVEGKSYKYDEIIFMGNDYLHLIKIIKFMKNQEIKLSIKNICILYKEFTNDFNKNLIGKSSRITSLNDLFSSVEINIEPINIGLGYKYENKQVNENISIEYCCNKDDEEGKILGYQLFKKALEVFSKEILYQGFLLGYSIVDLKINLLKANCQMCFYRDYYYASGARNALRNALSKANWQIGEPYMKVDITCSKSYLKNFNKFKGIKILIKLKENNFYKVIFEARLSTIINNLEEFYNSKEIVDIQMNVISYVNVEGESSENKKNKIITDIDMLINQ